MNATSKSARQLTLKDRLSRLSHAQAVKLLKNDGARLLQQGGLYDIDLDSQVSLDDQRFSLKLSDADVEITLDHRALSAISWRCSCQKGVCEHVAAAFSLILEEKTPLGLAKAPPEQVVKTTLSDEELVDAAIQERRERAEKEKMRVKSRDASTLWTDYLVTNFQSGKAYRVALRGWERGDSFCSCRPVRPRLSASRPPRNNWTCITLTAPLLAQY